MTVWVVPLCHRLEEFSMWTLADLVHLATGLADVATTVTRVTRPTAMGARHVAPTVRLSMQRRAAYRTWISIRAPLGEHSHIELIVTLWIRVTGEVRFLKPVFSSCVGVYIGLSSRYSLGLGDLLLWDLCQSLCLALVSTHAS